jgi:hypothetical protein
VSEVGRKCDAGAASRCVASSVARDGADPATHAAGRHVPRNDELGARGRGLSRRCRSAPLRRPDEASTEAVRAAHPRVLPDGNPLPLDRRGHDERPLGGIPLAQRRLRAGAQRTARAPRSPVRRALRLLGHPRRGPSRRGDRLCPRQPSPGRPREASRGLAVELGAHEDDPVASSSCRSGRHSTRSRERTFVRRPGRG